MTDGHVDTSDVDAPIPAVLTRAPGVVISLPGVEGRVEYVDEVRVVKLDRQGGVGP